MDTIVRQIFSKLIVFLLGGGIGALLCLFLTYLFVEKMNFAYMLAYPIGMVSAFFFNFLYHRSITFKVKDKTKNRMGRFVITNIVISAGIYGLIYIFTKYFGLWYIFSGVVSIGIMSLINFWMNTRWVFSITEPDRTDNISEL